MKIITVVGARPNFMKAAPIIAAIRKHNQEAAEGDAGLKGKAAPAVEHILVHTGQHYDSAMSDSFFSDLNLPAPDIRLGVGSGSHAVQTAEVLTKFEKVLLLERPDCVIVVGDVNSTIACALVTAKISFNSQGTRPLLAHVEAGLRSFDRSMPEEVNRVLTDHMCDLLFVTEDSAIRNLTNEGISPRAIHFVGNTMIDSLLAFKEKAETSTILERLGLRAPASASCEVQAVSCYALLTMHRPSNVDNRETFLNILGGLEELASAYPVVFPVHPRTRQRLKEFGLGLPLGTHATEVTLDAKGPGSEPRGLILTDPLGYLDFLCLMKHAMIVVTDSGGIQEETTCLNVPCVTVRDNTERPVTIDSGTNVLAGTTDDGIKTAIQRQIGTKGGNIMPKKWDGEAAIRIVDILISAHSERIWTRASDVGRAANVVCAHQA